MTSSSEKSPKVMNTRKDRGGQEGGMKLKHDAVAHCHLALLFEWSFADGGAADALRRLAAAELTPAALLLPPLAQDRAQDQAQDQAAALIRQFQEMGIAVLLRIPCDGPGEAAGAQPGTFAMPGRLPADGLHLDRAGNVKAWRHRLGSGRYDGVDPQADARPILGAGCGLSRHDAMEAGEAGADYVAFGTLEGQPSDPATLMDLLAWWHEMMELPSVALGAENIDALAAFAEAGADFLHVGPMLWKNPDELVAALSRIASPQAS